MPKIRSFLKQVKYGLPYITEYLALHIMGTGCGGPISLSTSSVSIPACRNRLLHQVDRSCASVTGQPVVKFLWQNLVCALAYHTLSSLTTGRTSPVRKQLPHVLTKYKIAHRFLTLYNPQGNDQAEISNHTILDSCARALTRQMANWSRNLPECSGHIEPRSAPPWERLHSHQPKERRPSSQSTFVCRHCAQNMSIGIRMPLSSGLHKISLKKGGDRPQFGVQPTSNKLQDTVYDIYNTRGVNGVSKTFNKRCQ